MINLSEGERQEAINLSEGEKIKRINEAKGTAAEIAIVAKAKAEAMALVSSALAVEGGNDAMNMQLKEQFIGQVGKVLNEADVSVVPAEMAKLEGFFEGMEQVTNTVKGGRS